MTLAVDVFKAQLVIHLSCLQVNQVMLMTKMCDSLLIFLVVFFYQRMCWSTIKTHVVLARITMIYEARTKTLLTSTTNVFSWNINSLEGQVLLMWLMTPNLSWQLNTGFVELKLTGITTVCWALDCFPTSITQCTIILLKSQVKSMWWQHFLHTVWTRFGTRFFLDICFMNSANNFFFYK